jgi:hypothetical protein
MVTLYSGSGEYRNNKILMSTIDDVREQIASPAGKQRQAMQCQRTYNCPRIASWLFQPTYKGFSC